VGGIDLHRTPQIGGTLLLVARERTALDEGLRLNNCLHADRSLRSSAIPPPPYYVRGARMLYFLLL
jgi:hypothetical protein